MKGPGVEPPSIPKIEEAAEAYVEIRHKRMALTEKEVTARTILSHVMGEHKGELPKDEDGNLFYPYDGKRVLLLCGKERIKVKQDGEEDD